MSWTQLIVALVGAVTSAVTAGVYINFSARVMPALRRLAAADGIATMQKFNRNAVRAPFMMCFFGAAAVGGYFVVRALRGAHSGADLIAAAGGGLYLVGFILTIAYNVPLNNRLAAVSATSPDSASVWEEYVQKWTTANSIRAVFSTVAAAALAAAAVAILGDPAAG